MDEELFKVLADNDDLGLKEISTLFEMDEDKFNALAPHIFEIYSEILNSPDARIKFRKALIDENIDPEALITDRKKLMEEIDNLDYSEAKKGFLKDVFDMFTISITSASSETGTIVSIPIQLCNVDAKLPTYATDGSAAMDVYSPIDFTVNPGETKIIPLGFKVSIPEGYALLIQARSGLSAKTHLRVANAPGLIDSDYHNEVGLIVENNISPIVDIENTLKPLIDGSFNKIEPSYGSSYSISKGERCCQMRLVEVPKINWIPVKHIGDTNTDHGKGFGSTGSF